MSSVPFLMNEYKERMKEFDDRIMLLLDNPDKKKARRSNRDISEARQTFMESFSSKVECEFDEICTDYGLCGNCKKNEYKIAKSYFEDIAQSTGVTL